MISHDFTILRAVFEKLKASASIFQDLPRGCMRSSCGPNIKAWWWLYVMYNGAGRFSPGDMAWIWWGFPVSCNDFHGSACTSLCVQEKVVPVASSYRKLQFIFSSGGYTSYRWVRPTQPQKLQYCSAAQSVHPSGRSCCRPARYPAERSSCAWSYSQISA